MEKLVKIVKREKKYAIYLTILIIILINLFLLPNSETNIQLPEKINENYLSPISPSNNLKENQIPIKVEEKENNNINDDEEIVEKKNNEPNFENNNINKNENNLNKEENKINDNDSEFTRRFLRSFENICLFSFISILIYLLLTNGNRNHNNLNDEINTDSKKKNEKDGYELLEDDTEYFEKI